MSDDIAETIEVVRSWAGNVQGSHTIGAHVLDLIAEIERLRAGVSPQPEISAERLFEVISDALTQSGQSHVIGSDVARARNAVLPFIASARPQPEITRQQIADTLDHVFNEVLRTQRSGSWFRTGCDRIDLAAEAVWALLADGATPAGPEGET